MKIVPEAFSAWIDKQPPGPPKLIVKGEIEVPTSGWSATLTPALQGINPNIIVLDLTLNRPTGMVSQVISTITARYEERPPNSEYTEATIRHDGQHFTIPVRRTV